MLSSIGGSGGELLAPATETATSTFRKPSLDQPGSRIAQNTTQDAPYGLAKRKADDQLSAPKDKTVRPNMASARPSQTLSNTPKIQTSNTAPAKPKLTSSPAGIPMPYRGTGKPSTASPIPARAEPKAPPKKGSYAEIMARAKASHTASAHVGIIKHKPKEKLSKKEQIALAKGLTLKTKQNARDLTRPNSVDPKLTSPHTPDGPNNKPRANGASSSKKPPQPSYTGTAKPKPTPSYKGTMKPLPPTSTSLTKKPPRDSDSDPNHPRSRSTSVPYNNNTNSKPRARASSPSEEGEEEEESADEEEPYESDLSDMEAGFSDVEEEDKRALKAAKREDQFEAMMERELKRQKERKRREVAAAAARGRGG